MTNEKRQNKCLNCKFRETKKNTTHIECTHPYVEKLGVKRAARALEIKVVYFGVLKGWFMWPYYYDSTWLDNCVGCQVDD